MIEFISGVGALGVTYHSCPYWRRRKGTPSIHVCLWFVKIIIQLPFEHIAPLGHGTATSSYGVFWWPAINTKPKFYWSTLRESK
tara:strand:+ start:576 stop:827 length:252 start_codon:yes stop_codon:yes gene_type:complete